MLPLINLLSVSFSELNDIYLLIDLVVIFQSGEGYTGINDSVLTFDVDRSANSPDNGRIMEELGRPKATYGVKR